MPIEARLLLGWMTREMATLFLTSERIPPLTEQEAGDLWAQYRERVEALLPEPLSESQPLSHSDKRTREMFLRHCYQQQKHDVEDVIKLDLRSLPVRQFRIIAPRSQNYEGMVRTRATWATAALPTNTQEPDLQGTYNQTENNTDAWFEIPHAEFVFPYTPDIIRFHIKHGDRWVTATPDDARHIL